MTVAETPAICKIFQENDRIRKATLKKLDLDSLVELRATSKQFGKFVENEIWRSVEIEHYELKNFKHMFEKNIEKIEHLTVNGNYEHLGEVAAETIFKKLVNLKSVEIKNFYSASTFNQVIQSLTSIQESKVKKVNIAFVNDNEAGEDDQGMENLADCKISISQLSKLKNLEIFSVSDSQISQKDITFMIKQLESSNLREITIISGDFIEAELFEIIGKKYATSIKVLELRKIDQHGLDDFESMLKKCRNLEKLYLSEIYTTLGTQIISDVSPDDLKSLRTLQINKHQFKDQFNCFLNQDWSSVQVLILCGCKLSPETSNIIADRFNNLSILDLVDIESGPEEYRTILENCSQNLETLQIVAPRFPISHAWSPAIVFNCLKTAAFIATDLNSSILHSILTTNKHLQELTIETLLLENQEKFLKQLENLKAQGNIFSKNLRKLNIFNVYWADLNIMKRIISALNYNISDVHIAECNVFSDEMEELSKAFPSISFDLVVSEFNDEYNDGNEFGNVDSDVDIPGRRAQGGGPRNYPPMEMGFDPRGPPIPVKYGSDQEFDDYEDTFNSSDRYMDYSNNNNVPEAGKIRNVKNAGDKNRMTRGNGSEANGESYYSDSVNDVD